MGILENFIFSNKVKIHQIDPVILRREKLIARIEEQLKLLENPNVDYIAKIRNVRCKETNRVIREEYDKKVNRWWFEEKGKIYIQVKYGTSIIELRKGKPSIEVKDIDELREVLEKLITAIEDGEIDIVLKDVGLKIRKKFL